MRRIVIYILIARVLRKAIGILLRETIIRKIYYYSSMSIYIIVRREFRITRN